MQAGAAGHAAHPAPGSVMDRSFVYVCGCITARVPPTRCFGLVRRPRFQSRSPGGSEPHRAGAWWQRDRLGPHLSLCGAVAHFVQRRHGSGNGPVRFRRIAGVDVPSYASYLISSPSSATIASWSNPTCAATSSTDSPAEDCCPCTHGKTGSEAAARVGGTLASLECALGHPLIRRHSLLAQA